MTEMSAPLAQDEPARIVVHWLEKSRAQRLVWLLEECKIPYKIKPYKRLHGHAPPEMKQVHPLGKSPELTIQAPGQTELLALAESGTIFEYLVDHFAPHLAPERYRNGEEGKVCGETASWLRYRYYMHYSEGSFMSLIMRIHDLHGIKGADASSTSTNLKSNLDTHLMFLDSQMSSSPQYGLYLCGRTFTAVDIMMSFPLLVVQSSMGGLARYPGLQAYVERLIDRPAWQTAVEKAQEASGERYSIL